MWGEILKILVEKVNEGVDVRLIYDDVGSLILFRFISGIRMILKQKI